MAVTLLVTIAAVLAWGTIYEARFGTAAVQRAVYQSWWFQALLGFLAVNLAIAASQRYPWQRRHVPFVLAHIGIILILTGGILGGRFGIEGQLIIPEGRSEQVLETPGNVLALHQPNPGVDAVLPTSFAARAWVQEPDWRIPVRLEDRQLTLTVDRYYPDAVIEESITDGGEADNPAVQLVLEHGEQRDAVWLLARDPQRFGFGWGEAHVLFLEAQTDEQLAQWLGRSGAAQHSRGMLSITLPGMSRPREIPVPEAQGTEIALKGTPYRITFRDYFPDFAITVHGPVSRSADPNNPAIAFVITGPEGSDPYLLFARHPEFQSVHGLTHVIAAEATYTHPMSAVLPPNGIALIVAPDGRLLAVLTDGEGARREVVDPVVAGTRYTHPTLGYAATVAAQYRRARVEAQFTNRSRDVKAEAVHVILEEGGEPRSPGPPGAAAGAGADGESRGGRAEAWVRLRGSAELAMGREPLTVTYGPGRRELPFSVKLLDFRKTDYPGTQMPAAFESDVEMTDRQRGIILMRTIRMNKPLRYRGYHLYQASYIPGPPETTVLAVRNDPGTPFVYAGFLIVIGGVTGLFLSRRKAAGRSRPRAGRRQGRAP